MTAITTLPTADDRFVEPITFPFKIILPALLGAIASVADPIMAAGVISNVVGIILGGTQVLDASGMTVVEGGFDTTPLIALAIYLFAVATAVETGKLLAERQVRPRRSPIHTVLLVGTALAWAAMGVFMSLVRGFEAALTGGRVTSHSSGSALAEGTHDWVFAVVMGVLYFGSGLCIIAASHGYLSSPWHLVRPAQRKASQGTARARRKLAYQRHLDLAVSKNAAQLPLLQADARAALTALRNAEALLKDEIRVALAAHLANPAESGSLRMPHQGTRAIEPGATPPNPPTTDEPVDEEGQ